MDFFETSIERLDLFAPKLAQRIRKARDLAQENYQIVDTKSGALTMTVKDPQGRVRFLHSRHNPQVEARRAIEKTIDPQADCVVIAGFGLGWHIEAALARAPKASVIVFEKEPASLAAAFKARDFKPLFESERLDLALGETSEDLLLLLEGKATQKVSFFLHQPSADLNPEFYQNLKNVLYSWINGKEVNLATLVRFEQLWTRNLLRNVKNFARFPGVSELFGSQKGIPAIIVGAGPSLGKNILLLKQAQKKCLIIAVDTIYKVLLAHQIVPDFVVAVDPQLVNVHFVTGTKASSILVSDSAISPAFLHNHQGPIALSAVPFPFAAWFEKFFGTKGALASGGSVSTSAFDLAIKLGANPIILVGQDLAYSLDKIHVAGTSGEERWENSATRTTPVTRQLKSFLNKNSTLKIRSWDQTDLVWSDRKFVTFLWWFEQQIKKHATRVRVINSTEGGAMIKGAESLKLQQILSELPERKIEIKPPKVNANPDYAACLNEAKRFNEFLTEMISLLSKAEETCQGVLTQTIPLETALPLLDRTDDWIYANPEWSTLISSSLQRVIHTVKEGLALNREVSDPIAESASLYQGIREAAMTLKKQVEVFLLKNLS